VELLPWWVVGIIVVRDTFLLTGSCVLAHRAAAKRGVSIFSSTIQSENPLEIKVEREREGGWGGCVILRLRKTIQGGRGEERKEQEGKREKIDVYIRVCTDVNMYIYVCM